jgi:hypothetical protein
MLRALGPGSVSSVLKIGLDVFHVLLWLLLILALLGVLGLLVAQPFLSANLSVQGTSDDDPERMRALLRSPMIPAVVAAGALYLGGLVFIVGRLKRVFKTLIQGDPFQPENVRRLRSIGFVLGGLELLSYVVRGVLSWWSLRQDLDFRQVGEDFNLTIWFAVLVVLVLAEVFREGARLRREAELTI